MRNKIKPIHPREILIEEFLRPFNVSQYRVAMDIGVSPRRINEIAHGIRAISVDTALRLGKYFSTSPQFWLNLQTHYDLEIAADRLSSELKHSVKTFQLA